MMNVKIDDYDVVRDGVLVLNSTNTITFSIYNLEFVFDFRKEESGKRDVFQESSGRNRLLIHLINFDNTLGTGFSDPMEVATLETGEKLYMLFAVYAIADNLRILHYTWLKRRLIVEGGGHE